MIATVVLGTYWALDYFAAPQTWPKLWLIRLGIIITLLWFPFILKRAILRRYFLWISTVASLIVSWGVCLMYAISQPDEAVYHFYYVGLIITMLGAPAVFGLFFRQATVLGLGTLVVYGWIALGVHRLLLSPVGRVNFLVSCFFLIGSLCIGMTSGFFNERQQRRDFLQECVIEQQRAEAERLRHQADRLLLNILPSEVAQTLKQSSQIIAEDFAQASVLFADIVNFTVLSSRMAPAQVVKMLNEVFSHFDELTEDYGLEKIKTIGDCYMVAAGVPRPRYDHAQALANLALDIQAFSKNYTLDGEPLGFRIGINSGPVTAGVIGRKKFIYDLWGDVVNTASRMESHGQSGQIQITQATYDLIHQQFNCQCCGELSIKGKGRMTVYWLLGKLF